MRIRQLISALLGLFSLVIAGYAIYFYATTPPHDWALLLGAILGAVAGIVFLLMAASPGGAKRRKPHPSPIIDSLQTRIGRLEERLGEKDRDLAAIVAERRKVQKQYRWQYNSLTGRPMTPEMIAQRPEIRSCEARITALLSQEASVELEQDSIGAAITELRRELAVDEAAFRRQTGQTASGNP